MMYSSIHDIIKADENDSTKLLVQYFSIKQKNTDINDFDAHDNTPLMWTAMLGRSNQFMCLISNGADPELRNCNNHSALDLAILNGHKDIVVNLITRGIDVNATNGNDSTHSALGCTFSEKDVRVDIVILLIVAGADPNIFIENCTLGITPLDVAIRLDNEMLIRLLLTAGAVPHFISKESRLSILYNHSCSSEFHITLAQIERNCRDMKCSVHCGYNGCKFCNFRLKLTKEQMNKMRS